MPRPVYLVHWLLLLLLGGGSRFSLRIIGQGGVGILPRRRSRGKRVMVVGAGWAGAQVIREIQAGRYGDCTAVLAVDDNEAKRGAALGRVPVLMDTHKVGEYVQQYRVDEIIIAIATPNGDLSELIHRCIDTGCHVRMVSTLRDVNTGAPALGRVREVNIGDLLGRAEKHLDMTEVEAYFAGKRVLVTGGGGSIGSELCRQIMSFTPAKLVLYDISENYIYDLFFELQEKYGALTRNTVELRVGSIRDKATLDRVFSEFQPEIVIHAAAHKHVPLMEDSPEQAIINNVFGTLNVAQCSLEHGVKRFVMISTDKAVNPTNIMGASKRMAEIIIEALQARGKTQFTAVRFGNVLGSNGSVVPLFERQIRAGGPVTLTHPDIIRYFMTIPEAVQLVLEAGSLAQSGEVFVLDMGKPVHILELAENLIRLSGLTPYQDIQIEEIGLRPGEKLYEELLTKSADLSRTENDKIFVEFKPIIPEAALERRLAELSNVLEHGRRTDIFRTLHQLVPTFHDPEEVNRAALSRLAEADGAAEEDEEETCPFEEKALQHIG